MAKVNLSIPNELQDRLEKHKLHVNLSKVFQKAITKEIDRREEFQLRLHTEVGSMPEIIERLKKEKITSTGSYYSRGEFEGLQWAKHAHYEELCYAAEVFTPDGNCFRDKILGEVLTTYIEDIEVLKPASGQIRETDSPIPEPFIDIFMRGWKEGVSQFWKEVKQHL